MQWYSIKVLILVLLSGCALPNEKTNSPEKEISVKVDKRIELLSILARLADFEEYSDRTIESYVLDIDEHFAKIQNHEIIDLLKKLRDSTGLGYDALMIMAVHLDETDVTKSGVRIEEISAQESRWPKKDVEEFFTLLEDFYSKSNFERFFNDHEPLYDSVTSKYQIIANKVNLTWFDNLLGKSHAKFKIVLGLGNGYGNYGPRFTSDSGDDDIFYSIIGCGDVDELGMPIFFEEHETPTIIHEFLHSYVNPAALEYKKELKPFGEEMLALSKSEMNQQAYGDWQTVINESLVRALVVKYLEQNSKNPSDSKRKAVLQSIQGFYWMPFILKVVDDFYQNKPSSSNAGNLVAHVAQSFNNNYEPFEIYKNNFLENQGYVVSVHPFQNGDSLVNPSVSKISFTFNKPLITDQYGFGPDKLGFDYYPKYPDEDSVFLFSDANRTISIQNIRLEPNKEYHMKLIGRMFYTEDGHLCDYYYLNFKTRSD